MRILGGDASRFKSEKKRERARAPNRCCAHTTLYSKKQGTKEEKRDADDGERGQSQGFIGTYATLPVDCTSLVASRNHRRRINIKRDSLSPTLCDRRARTRQSKVRGFACWMNIALYYKTRCSIERARKKKGGGTSYRNWGGDWQQGDWRIASIKSRLQTNSSCLMPPPGQIFPLYNYNHIQLYYKEELYSLSVSHMANPYFT